MKVLHVVEFIGMIFFLALALVHYYMGVHDHDVYYIVMFLIDLKISNSIAKAVNNTNDT